MLFVMSLGEVQHVALMCNERALRDTELLSRDESESMRMMFVRAAMSTKEQFMFEFSRPQLRTLDMLLTDRDPREGKTPDGLPIMQLVEKVWETLLEGTNARDTDNDLNTNPDDRETTVRPGTL